MQKQLNLIEKQKKSSFPRVRMPYDDTTQTGYFVTLAIQIVAIMIVGAIISLVNTLLFGVCFYFSAFIDDLLTTLKKIDLIWCEPTEGKEYESFGLMKEFIHFHYEIMGYNMN